MDDLVAFLRARLDEDEAAAKAAAKTTAAQWRPDGHWVLYEHPDDSTQAVALNEDFDREPIAHIARHDPARVLAEVAAKRAILARHHPQDHALHGRLCAWCSSTSVSLYQKWPCPDARDLAAVYASHPDYRPEWKPQP